MLIRLQIFIFLLLATAASLDAQVITVNPVFPTAADPVVITFNADKGDMGLKDYPGDDVYAHTGVITDKSSGGSDWKYVIATWSTNTSQGKAYKSVCQCLYPDNIPLHTRILRCSCRGEDTKACVCLQEFGRRCNGP